VTIDTKKSKRWRRALLLGIAVASAIDLTAGTALAQRHRGDWRRHDDHRDRHREHREHRNWWGWTGGYYTPPPVVYGYYDPYYYPAYNPPPVVYGGPGVGVNLRFNVR
jgi:hypothetical protein